MNAEESDPIKALGQNIVRFRKELGLTQAEAAARIGVHQQMLSKWENGSNLPNVPSLLKIANLFGVSLDVLFGLPGSPLDPTSARTDAASADAGPGILPVTGLFACDRDGWCTEKVLLTYAQLPEGCSVTSGVFAIMPFDSCVEAMGIKQGNVAYCDPTAIPDTGDNVLVRNRDGRVSIKYFQGRDEESWKLGGWTEPDEQGARRMYSVEYALDSISVVACVSTVLLKGLGSPPS
jgi:Predicted transcriptional regulators